MEYALLVRKKLHIGWIFFLFISRIFHFSMDSAHLRRLRLLVCLWWLTNVCRHCCDGNIRTRFLLISSFSSFFAERRRALRQEQRSLEHQRQNESLPVSASNGEPSSNDSHIPSLNALNDSRDELKTNSLSNNDARANKEKESEEKLASKAEEYLEMMKESSCRISLNIVESCDVWAARDNEKWQPHNACLDSQGVVIVITNFLLDNCRLYPSLDSSIGSELLRRLKLCLENPRKQSKDTIKLPSVSHLLPIRPQVSSPP